MAAVIRMWSRSSKHMQLSTRTKIVPTAHKSSESPQFMMATNLAHNPAPPTEESEQDLFARIAADIDPSFMDLTSPDFYELCTFFDMLN